MVVIRFGHPFWQIPLLMLHVVVTCPPGFTAEAFSSPERRARQFPVQTTTPTEVVEAQLTALMAGDLWTTYRLFSRSRRLALEEAARTDMRQTHVPPARITAAVRRALWDDGGRPLVGHDRHRILAVATDPCPERGRLLRTVCRVGIWNDGRRRHYLVTLTRQSGYDGGDPRDEDGFERCWFVLAIQREDGGGGEEPEDGTPPPGHEQPLRQPVTKTTA